MLLRARRVTKGDISLLVRQPIHHNLLLGIEISDRPNFRPISTPSKLQFQTHQKSQGIKGKYGKRVLYRGIEWVFQGSGNIQVDHVLLQLELSIYKFMTTNPYRN